MKQRYAPYVFSYSYWLSNKYVNSIMTWGRHVASESQITSEGVMTGH